MVIEPVNPPSSRPTACSMVDLPEPDGPNSATISPGMMSRLTPHRTWMVASPCRKLRLRFLRLTTGSLIAQNLDRVGARGLHFRLDPRQEAEHHRPRSDPGAPPRRSKN